MLPLLEQDDLKILISSINVAAALGQFIDHYHLSEQGWERHQLFKIELTPLTCSDFQY